MHMKFIVSFVLTILLFDITAVVTGQTILPPKVDSLLNVHGEIYFRFHLEDKSRVDSISGILSIDNYKDGEVYAYANPNEFTRFLTLHIDYTILPNPGSMLTDQELNMGNWQRNSDNMTLWNFYPTYDQYLSMMSGFASNYPSICKIDTIGTTVQGRLLLALKISDSVNFDRGVPQVLLTSSMHGDEIAGYVMMMHLIDSLLNAYGTAPRITNLIHNTQIFINPLANPDGTYYGGNATVSNARRNNQFIYDLNRNYPDPAAGQHPDGKMWQPETVAFMNYANIRHFTLSMNFHGGAEVVNYPWDTWSRVTADDSWWRYVSKEYADTCHQYGAAGYFTSPYTTGYSNGFAWYTITGGRQDYHNYFKHIREVTLEISATKNPPASTLLNYWKYNKRSFLNYIEQANYGINGKVYDSVTFAPIAAKVFITGHDIDSSFVYSSLPSGRYFRMIDTGPWTLTFSAPGYYSRTITGVSCARRATTQLNVKLRPINLYWPRSFQATAVSGNEIDLSWLKDASNDPVMIVANTTSTFGTPVSGTAYPAGSALAGGGTIIYNGPNPTCAHTLLNPNATWYYKAWSVLSGNTYSTAAAANATTLCGGYGTFPLTENFSTAVMQLPNCWSQEATGTSANYTNSWIRSNTSNAGGTAWEMRLRSNGVNPGTMRLKTFSFNTIGVTTLTLSFKYRFSGTGTGATMSIQSSSDGINWTPESWTLASSNITGAATTITISITNNLNSPSTMIAFVVTGDLNQVANWYIDDVSIKAPGYWVGGTAAALNDWHTATNWGDGVVPVIGTNVYIPQRSYLPVVSNTAQCNDLVISKNATVTVGSGKIITVNRNMTIQGP